MARFTSETKNAEIALVSIVHEITGTDGTSMDFIQSDAVSDTVKAAKYCAFLPLGETMQKNLERKQLSVADSVRRGKCEEAFFRMRFTFKKARNTTRTSKYYLVVLRRRKRLERGQPVTMDIASAD